MAEALMNHLGRGQFQAFSAGSAPAGFVHPMAITVLQKAKIPTEGLTSKSWTQYAGETFDFVITVCDRTQESCPIFPGQPISAHWGLKDPAEAIGTEEEKEKVFRRCFTEIKTRVGLLLALPMDYMTPDEITKKVQEIGQSLSD